MIETYFKYFPTLVTWSVVVCCITLVLFASGKIDAWQCGLIVFGVPAFLYVSFFIALAVVDGTSITIKHPMESKRNKGCLPYQI